MKGSLQWNSVEFILQVLWQNMTGHKLRGNLREMVPLQGLQNFSLFSAEERIGNVIFSLLEGEVTFPSVITP